MSPALSDSKQSHELICDPDGLRELARAATRHTHMAMKLPGHIMLIHMGLDRAARGIRLAACLCLAEVRTLPLTLMICVARHVLVEQWPCNQPSKFSNSCLDYDRSISENMSA